MKRRDYLVSSLSGLSILATGNVLGESDNTDSYDSVTKASPVKNGISKEGRFLAEKIAFSKDQNRIVFKQASLSPYDVEVGNSYEFKIKLIIGKNYSQEATRLVLSFPSNLGFSLPSLFGDEDNGYISVYVSNPNVIFRKSIFDMENGYFVTKQNANLRHRGQRLLVIDLNKGLKEDDVIKVHWGDVGSGFGPGTKVTMVSPQKDFQQYIWVRYFEDQNDGIPDHERDFKGYSRPRPEAEVHLAMKVGPRQLDHFRLFRKTNKAMLLPLDMYGNVAEVEDLQQIVALNQLPETNRAGVYEFQNKDVKIQSKKYRLTSSSKMDNVFEENNIYWGDTHTHSSISNDVIDRGRTEMGPGEMMDFARYNYGLDFYALTDHHQPWDIERNKIGRNRWEWTIDEVIKHDKTGEFLVFPSLEFRCNRGDTLPLFNFLPKYDEITDPSLTDIRKLWNKFKDKDIITIPHFHNPGSLDKDVWWTCPYEGMEPVIEIYSCHRSFEREFVMENSRGLVKRYRSDRSVPAFLANGHKYGLVANSDSHKGHAGAQALTAVYSEKLDKKSIFKAYRNRNVYATSGAHIRLLFTGNGELMGATQKNTTRKHLHIDVQGENTLKKVELFRNGDLHELFECKSKSFVKDIRVDDEASSNWYVRATQQDNHIAWSSPIWFV